LPKLTRRHEVFNFLPGPCTYALGVLCMFLNTAILGTLMFIGGLIKAALIHPKLQRKIAPYITKLLGLWGYVNGLTFKAISRANVKVIGAENLHSDRGYFLISNHLSGFDIAILGYIFRDIIPTPKYFLKRELLFVPFLGLACWALDMPFVRRRNAKKLRKNPHLRNTDLEATQKSCDQFKDIPTSIINFVEGTRINKKKHANQKSPYKNLLKPKASGMALTLATLGDQFEKILNITIIYPETTRLKHEVLKAVLLGKVHDVIIHVEQLDVPQIDYARYRSDSNYRVEFQRWLNELWSKKDQLINREIDQYWSQQDACSEHLKHNEVPRV